MNDAEAFGLRPHDAGCGCLFCPDTDRFHQVVKAPGLGAFCLKCLRPAGDPKALGPCDGGKA